MKTKKLPQDLVDTETLENDQEMIDDKVEGTKQKKVKTKRPRVWELDALRGIAILLVCWDHFMFDAFGLYGSHFWNSGVPFLENFATFASDYWSSELRLFWWPFFLFLFFFVSGVCTAFSRNNLFRAVKLGAVALLMTLVTYLLEKFGGMDGVFISWGVVHAFSTIVFIYAFIELFTGLILKAFKKEHWLRPMMSLVSLVFLNMFIILNDKFGVTITEIARGTASSPLNIEGLAWAFYMPRSEFRMISADYFPIFPYIIPFFIGATLSFVLYPKKKSLLPMLDGKWHYIFTIPGRVSIYLYVFVQVVAIVVLGIISLICTGEIGLF